MNTSDQKTVRHSPRVLLATLVLALLLGGCTSAVADRQQDIAERGREVMPFDLDRTTHHWAPSGRGLTQTVVADDPADNQQINLIRAHLRLEAERFERGDFQDPAAIHGGDMPGLSLLREHDGRITIAYEELPEGALLRFSTTDQQLVNALHAWGEAQLSDQGSHGEAG